MDRPKHLDEEVGPVAVALTLAVPAPPEFRADPVRRRCASPSPSGPARGAPTRGGPGGGCRCRCRCRRQCERVCARAATVVTQGFGDASGNRFGAAIRLLRRPRRVRSNNAPLDPMNSARLLAGPFDPHPYRTPSPLMSVCHEERPAPCYI